MNDNNVINMATDDDLPEELKHQNGFFYLAHAYSATTPELRRHNADHALWIYAHLLSQGVLTYNPIEATHRAATSYGWATDHTTYLALNEAFIDVCEGLIVVMSDGWEKSAGVAAEIEHAIKLGCAIWYLDCEEFDARHGYGKPENMPA